MKEKKNMELTELVFILDRSGSMCGLESDTIGGFNSMLAKQKREKGQANITTVLFDDRRKMLHFRLPLPYVQPMTEKDYFVRGCTALLDAVGHTIEDIESQLRCLPEEERAGKVIFVIITDGLENSSKDFSYEAVRKMIHQKKAEQWEFLFLGANMDAVAEASRFGIQKDRAVRYANDARGVSKNYVTVSNTISVMRTAPSMASVGAEWKKDIEEDYRERSSED